MKPLLFYYSRQRYQPLQGIIVEGGLVSQQSTAGGPGLLAKAGSQSSPGNFGSPEYRVDQTACADL